MSTRTKKIVESLLAGFFALIGGAALRPNKSLGLRMTVISILCLCLTACQTPKIWKGDLIPSDSHQTLHHDSTGVITRTTNQTNGQVGRTVYQVAYRATGAETSVPLFTVERVLDDPTPGPPVFDGSSGHALLRDRSSSYVYSFRERVFTRNVHSEGVYSGAYRNEF